MKSAKYKFKARVWKHKGPSAWHFVTLPKTLAVQIRKAHVLSEEGWGRLPAQAQIGKSKWKTAIWFDSKSKSYLLPIKAAAREAEHIEKGAMVALKLTIHREDLRLALLDRSK